MKHEAVSPDSASSTRTRRPTAWRKKSSLVTGGRRRRRAGGGCRRPRRPCAPRPTRKRCLWRTPRCGRWPPDHRSSPPRARPRGGCAAARRYHGRAPDLPPARVQRRRAHARRSAASSRCASSSTEVSQLPSNVSAVRRRWFARARRARRRRWPRAPRRSTLPTPFARRVGGSRPADRRRRRWPRRSRR